MLLTPRLLVRNPSDWLPVNFTKLKHLPPCFAQVREKGERRNFLERPTHTCQNADSVRSHRRERLIHAQAAGGYLSLSDPLDLHIQLWLQQGLVGNRQSRRRRKLSGGASLIAWESV